MKTFAPDQPRPDLRAYAVRPSRLRPGNHIVPLVGGGEAFRAMLGAIARARRSVCLETYILKADRTGERFADALIERARAGVDVRLIVDGIGTMGLDDDYVERLVEDGVQVLQYHPIRPWHKRFGLLRRDHRKILVIDDEVAFTGGLNISDDYASEADGGAGWHDVHCQVRGPIVTDLARLFRRVWVREGGDQFAIRARDDQPGASLARVVDNRKFRQRWKIRRAYLHAINRARSSISIANAYFLPDRGIRRALYKAHKRGVNVRVIVPGQSDVAVVKYAAEHLFGRMLARGVEILFWPDSMMHAKTAVIDGAWSAIGSYNLNRRSLLYDLEVLVEILDREVGAVMHAQFDRDAARCEPLTTAAWKRRPRLRKLLSWIAYQFRRWL